MYKGEDGQRLELLKTCRNKRVYALKGRWTI